MIDPAAISEETTPNCQDDSGSACNDLVSVKREELARYAHDAWSGWMSYMFSKCDHNVDGTMTIPSWAVERWSRQATTAYHALPASEKESDRDEADKILTVLSDR